LQALVTPVCLDFQVQSFLLFSSLQALASGLFCFYFFSKKWDEMGWMGHFHPTQIMRANTNSTMQTAALTLKTNILTS